MRIRSMLAMALVASGCGGPSPLEPAESDVLAEHLAIDPTNLPDYEPGFPPHYFPEVFDTDNTPFGNGVTAEGALLGRVLFFDRQLSRNGSVACASCHQAEHGFSDAARFSQGFDGGRTGAHSMRLANARFYGPGSMFWDKRARTLEAQVTEPIQDSVEMGFDAAHGGLEALATKLAAQPYYPILFKRAFGDAAITEKRLQAALAQYVRSLVSVNSRFDEGFAATFDPSRPDRGLNGPFPNFSAEENRGKTLFVLPPNAGGLGCAGCHQPPTFALAPNARSNGLDEGETRVFKSPSLKNVADDGAFMHDGRFTTLEQVVAHYSAGIQPGPALDNRLRTPDGRPLRLNIPEDDAAALVAFMKALSDPVLAADARFQSPFRE
jgi:cytochrome c peroxidase